MIRDMAQKGSAATEQPGAGAQPARARRNVLGALLKNPAVLAGLVILVGVGLFFGVRYYLDLKSHVAIETAEVSAPVISIGPETPGTLKQVFVKEGDRVSVGQQLFSVGNTVTTARTA